MHPAYSVIIFTTASGAGYGLLALLGILGLTGHDLPDRWFLTTGLVLALALVTVGLLSSTFHLGHPERAWRAFSQWRSSWLSREGVAAVVTFVPAGLLLLGSLAFEQLGGVWFIANAAVIALSVVTVFCTAMIYASLKTIRAWHSPWVAPAYLVLALASGSVLLVALWHLFGTPPQSVSYAACAALAGGLLMKLGYWQTIDRAARTHSMSAATGLGNGGPVRQIVAPHTGDNYIMREMGYSVARKHASKLRQFALVLGFLVPALAIVLATLTGDVIGLGLAFVALVSCAAGLVVERWLFFAEAKHVVSLYYGEAAA
jgi:DMSO reductase anchor subunit